MKVLYHIDNAAKWNMVLENAKNMLKNGKETSTTFDIEILANGIAVIQLQEQVAINSKLYIEFDELVKEKVVFAACKNALKKFVIEEKNLCSFVNVVPAGVVEIAIRHNQGYTYIKP